MNRIILTTAAVLFTLLISAQPPSGKAKPGTTYGAKVDKNNALESQKLPGMLNDKDTINVKI